MFTVAVIIVDWIISCILDTSREVVVYVDLSRKS